MAGTIPTIPDMFELVDRRLAEELPMPRLGSGTVMAVGVASCGMIAEAAKVATGLPLGSTNVMSPVRVAAFL